MLKHETGCNDERLQLLLSGDEASGEFRRMARHVDECPSCQHALTQLAGAEETWSDVSQLLADFNGTNTGGDSGLRAKSLDDGVMGYAHPEPNGAGSPLEDQTDWAADNASIRARLEFLGPASHPEMLGRLGRYEIERVVGAGGMGIVLKAFDGELNRPVAIKVLAPHLCGSGPARKRFEREARAAAAVVHEHIVAIHNVETDGKTPFIVMQFVPGESLQARVDREGPLLSREILRIGMQAAAGLAAAHEQGVVHRDIKPANILLENDVDRALVTDFGLARTVDDASLTQTGVIAGTPHYMSPEQASSDYVDHRTDLFSLGAVLYFMATGRPPFRADKAMGVLHRICSERHRSAYEVNNEIPLELSDLIDQLLEKKPANRFQTASPLRKQLSEMLASIQEGRRPRIWDSLRRFSRRKRRVLTRVALSAAAAGAIFVAYQVWPGDQSNRSTDAIVNSPKSETATVAPLVTPHLTNDSDYSIVTRQLDEQLSQLEGSFDTSDADQIDSNWPNDMKSIHDRLDHVQRGSWPE